MITAAEAFIHKMQLKNFNCRDVENPGADA
jgi:hypothetical protein